MKVYREREAELVKEAVKLEKETGVNQTSILRVLRNLKSKEIKDKIIADYKDETNTLSITDIGKKYGMSRQNVHIILSKNLPREEMKRIKKVKNIMKHADNVDKYLNNLVKENRVTVTMLNDNVMQDTENNKYYRIKFLNTLTQIYYNADTQLFLKKHRTSSSNYEPSGFIVSRETFKYRSTLLNKEVMEKSFNAELECYVITK